MSDEAKAGYFATLGSATRGIEELARLNILLFKAELKANTAALASYLVAGLVAAVTGVVSVVFIFVAIYTALGAWGMSPPMAALLMAIASGAASLGMILFLRTRLRVWSLLPHRTIAQFRTNIASVAEGLQNARSE